MTVTKDVLDHSAKTTADVVPGTVLGMRGPGFAVVTVGDCRSTGEGAGPGTGAGGTQVVATGVSFSPRARINLSSEGGGASGALAVLTTAPAGAQGAAAFPLPPEDPAEVGGPRVQTVIPKVWPHGTSEVHIVGRRLSEYPLDVFAAVSPEGEQDLSELITIDADAWVEDPEGAGLEGSFDGLDVVRVDVFVDPAAIIGSQGGISVVRSTEEED